MDNNNPLVRLSIFGRVKKMMEYYNGIKLEKNDRKLLRGLYLKNLNDFDEQMEDRYANMTLF
jgi:hypothetical protein